MCTQLQMRRMMMQGCKHERECDLSRVDILPRMTAHCISALSLSALFLFLSLFLSLSLSLSLSSLKML